MKNAEKVGSSDACSNALQDRGLKAEGIPCTFMTKYACIVDAGESTRKRMEGALP